MNNTVVLLCLCMTLGIIAIPLYIWITLNWVKKIQKKVDNIKGVAATINVQPNIVKGIRLWVTITDKGITRYFDIDDPDNLSDDLVLMQISGNEVYLIKDNKTNKRYKENPEIG